MPKHHSVRLVFALIVILVLCFIGRNLYRRYVNNALVAAIRAKDVSAVRSLLNRGAGPNYRYSDPSIDGRQAIPIPVLNLAFSNLVRGDPSGYNVTVRNLSEITSISFIPNPNAEAIVCLLLRRGARIQDEHYLNWACSYGDVPVARCLLDNGADPKSPENSVALGAAIDYATSYRTTVSGDRRFSDATTPAEKAEVARRQAVSRQLVQLLREHGVRLTLTQAQALGDRASIKEALKANAPDGTDEGYIALCTAAHKDDLELMRLLLKQGIDPDHQPSRSGTNAFRIYETPLYAAAASGHLDAVKLLLAHGARPNLANNNFESALTAAARSGNLEMVKLLIEHGADPGSVNRGTPSALSAAAGSGNLELVKLMLAHGADVNASRYISPLESAVGSGRPTVIRLLLAHGADPNEQRNGHFGVLTAALRRAPGVTADLLKHGAKVNPAPNPSVIMAAGSGQEPVSPLMTAVWYAPQYEAMLLKAGAKIGPDRPCVCAAAARHGRLDLLPKLLAYGADINGITSDHETALSLCIERAPASVKMLLEHGADPNFVARDQRTPLAMAAMIGNAGIVRLLLAHGANVNAHPARDHTALYWARRKNHADVVALLQQAGAKE